MKKTFRFAASFAVASAFTLPAFAENWDVSVWGKRRAFTEHVERLAELKVGVGVHKVMAGGLQRNVARANGVCKRAAAHRLVMLVLGDIDKGRVGRPGLIAAARQAAIVPVVIQLQKLNR